MHMQNKLQYAERKRKFTIWNTV